MPNPQPPSVLIAEDNRIMADVLRRALEHGGFRGQIARTGVEAVEACSMSDFDAIVTDYQMPGLNGIEFVKRLRSSDRNRTAPVIFVSGKGLELDTEMLRQEYDVRKVMFKPFSPRELIGCLHNCLLHSRISAST